MIKRVVWTLFAVLICCLSAAANSYYNGYVENGYTYRDGYWYYGSQAYTREWRPYTYYTSYGYNCYSYPQTGYKWYYTEYTAPKAAAYALPTPNDPSWRSKLLDIAKQRDAIEGQMRLSALDNAMYIEAVNALGLRGNFNWQQYGQSVPYPTNTYGTYQQANYQLGSFGAQGNTIYGNQVATMAQIYGSADMSLLFQQSAKLTENAQELAGQAHGQFVDAVRTEGGNRARVAEILAKQQAAMGVLQATGAAAAQALTAAEGQSAKVFQTVTSFSNSANGSVQQPSPQVLPAKRIPLNSQEQPQRIPNKIDLDAARDKVMEKYCFACHNQKDKAAKLDLTVGYAQLDDELKDLIWDRLTHKDPDKRMPAAPKGGTAPVPTDEEGMIFERRIAAKR